MTLANVNEAISAHSTEVPSVSMGLRVNVANGHRSRYDRASNAANKTKLRCRTDLRARAGSATTVARANAIE